MSSYEREKKKKIINLFSMSEKLVIGSGYFLLYHSLSLDVHNFFS